MPREDASEDSRWVAGVSIGRRSGRMKAAIVKGIGEGWRFRFLCCYALSIPSNEVGNITLHEQLANALTDLSMRARVPIEEIETLGVHDPPNHPLTSVAMAEITGLTTVSQFALRDQACGGRGYPLAPIPNWLLFHSPRERRLQIHVGATLRLIVLEPENAPRKMVCFDVCPCCTFLDGLVQRLSKNALSYDPNGALAVQGLVSEQLASHWASHPFFLRQAPRVCEPGDFDDDFFDNSLTIARELRLSARDVLCTANHFVVRQLELSLRRLNATPKTIAKIIVSGGGLNNGLLWKLLQDVAAPLPLIRTDELGVPSEAARTIQAALLGYCVLENLPGNVPIFTGAIAPRVLGVISPGSEEHWDRWVCTVADRFDLERDNQINTRKAA